MVNLLYVPGFWILVGAADLAWATVFFTKMVHTVWFDEWNVHDWFSYVALACAAIGLGIIWPFTLLAYWVDPYFNKSFTPEEKIRCYRCMTELRKFDAFCSTCGADQTTIVPIHKE